MDGRGRRGLSGRARAPGDGRGARGRARASAGATDGRGRTGARSGQPIRTERIDIAPPSKPTTG